MKTTVYYAVSRKNRTLEKLPGFSRWEHVQGAFRFGIMLSDGTMADAIGRAPWRKVVAYCTVHGYRIL